MKKSVFGMLAALFVLLGIATSSVVAQVDLSSLSTWRLFRRAPSQFQKGFTYLKWGDQFLTHAERSFRALKLTGAEWVSFVPIYYQDRVDSIEIYRHPVLSPTDSELEGAILKARAEGFKILLKPHVDVMIDPWKAEWANGKEAWLAKYREFIDQHPIKISADGDTGEVTGEKNWFRRLFSWRGEIHAGSDDSLRKWFDSYTTYIVHFAEMAQRLGVEEFCIGTELEKVKGYQEHWERVIREVRRVYAGKILYDTNHNSVKEVPFWDKLDYVGVSAYYPLAIRSNATEREMRAGLAATLDDLEKYFAQLGKQFGRKFDVLFGEAGYTDFRGTAKTPWDFLLGNGVSLSEQASAYKVSLEAYPKRQWLKGVFFWRWSVEPEDRYFDYDHYTPYTKPAEAEIRKAWHGSSFTIDCPADGDCMYPGSTNWRLE